MRGGGHARACACSFSLRCALTCDPRFPPLAHRQLCQASESVGSVGSLPCGRAVCLYLCPGFGRGVSCDSSQRCSCGVVSACFDIPTILPLTVTILFSQPRKYYAFLSKTKTWFLWFPIFVFGEFWGPVWGVKRGACFWWQQQSMVLINRSSAHPHSRAFSFSSLGFVFFAPPVSSSLVPLFFSTLCGSRGASLLCRAS